MVAIAIAGLSSCGVDACYSADDSIEIAHCEARVRLNKYPADAADTIGFLLEYHGEAPNREIYNVLIRWGLKRSQRFVDLLSTLSSVQQQEMAARLAFAIDDGDLAGEFDHAFRGHATSPIILLIRANLIE